MGLLVTVFEDGRILLGWMVSRNGSKSPTRSPVPCGRSNRRSRRRDFADLYRRARPNDSRAAPDNVGDLLVALSADHHVAADDFLRLGKWSIGKAGRRQESATGFEPA